MLGFRFFSIFSLLLASLFIQKSFDVSTILVAHEQLSGAEKLPVIQLVKVTKIVSKHKSHKTFFIPVSVFGLSEEFQVSSQKISSIVSFIPKPSFENPTRAPPVS